ncbi:MAG: response regulator [Proteobacteria bacterium]|nr:response regulator [Pseudomonadota bacterium]
MQIKTFSTKSTVLKATFCFCVLGLTLLRPVYAQVGKNINFERISIEQGLSQISVTSIFQDSQGFIWFGTLDGLNKYDGYQFVIYRHDLDDSASLSNSYILSIFEDTKGNLWVGTNGGGLNRFDRKAETFTRYQHRANDTKSLSNNFVWSIFEDSKGKLWIGTEDGLNKLGNRSETFTHYLHKDDNPSSLSHNKVRSILEDEDGNLWIGTEGGGLNKFDRKTETFSHYVNKTDNPKSLSHNSVWSIFEDHEGILWIGTLGGGLNRFDRKTETFTHYVNQANNPRSISNNTIRAILEDTGGNLWIGTHGGGLNRFDRETETFTHYMNQADNPHSISQDKIRSIFEDDGGNLWIATHSGLNKFDRKAENFILYKHQTDDLNSLNHDFVYSIYEDDEENLWLGTNNGLNKYNRKLDTFTHYTHDADSPKSISHNAIRSIIEDAEGNLWIGVLRGGLNKFNRKTETFTHYLHQDDNPKSLSSNMVYSILEDSRGELWIGTIGGGLNRFDRKTKTFSHYSTQADNPNSLSHNFIYSIFEDSEGNLWIGTEDGLNSFDRQTEYFVRYLNQAGNSKSLSSNLVLTIFEDSRGDLWIGTTGGLNSFDQRSKSFTCYREKDGLPNDVIYGILEDNKGNLWLSTNNGISKFNPNTKTISNYNMKDGLQSNEFNSGAYHKGRSGRMYFGGINGFNEFYPENVENSTYVPPVVITDFLLFNKPVGVAKASVKSDGYQLEQHINFTKEITLDYTDYIFAFEFSALNYRQSDKNQFAYKLEGFDRDWVETDYRHRRTTYTDLYHGEYVFRVKASNDDGYWNTEGTNIRMTILPPPWKTWWAYSLYTLAVLALIFWFVQSQRKKVKQKQKELDREKQVSARLIQLDKLKNEFLANTSHELRTPLNGIIGIAESLIDGMEEWSSEKIYSNLAMIASSGKRLSSLVNDVLDFSKMQHRTLELSTNPVDLCSISNVVLTTSKTLLGDKNLKLLNDIDTNIPTVNADENRLQQIMYNLIGNAVKFTETGSVKVSAIVKESRMEVRVSDTGIGIPKEKIDRVFESFEQAEGSTARVYGGTGLGLAVTKQLVELHDGEIWAESTEGQGSTFFFTLPISGEKASMLKAEEQPVSKVHVLEPIITNPMDLISKIEDVAPAEGNFNILIVDDDPVNLQVLENHLSLQNYNITQALNGQEALNLIEGEQRFDLILLDIMMPKMSGYEVTEMLRESHAAHELPIIFLSAKNQVVDLITGFTAGGNDYLTKPISKAELLSRVKTHLQLLDINRNLEQKVRDRTAEVVRQKEEIQAQAKELEKINLELEKLSIVASETDNAVTIMDAGGNIEWVNKAFERFYRTSFEEYIEEKGRNIIEASPNPKITNAINECISHNNPVSYESYIKMKKGENIWAHTTLTPMIDSYGNLLKLISIDSDITELKKAQQRAISHAHKAGMADVAINTIHNVGNILNSVKTSIGISSKMIKKPTLKGFELANNLLRENIDKLEDFICNDPKGLKLMRFYFDLENVLKKERTEIEDGIFEIESRIQTIDDVIKAQRGYTEDVVFFVEDIDLVEILEDAITMNLDLIENNNIKIEKEMMDIHPIPVQKMKMIQILMNLIINAKEAMDSTPDDSKLIKFFLEKHEDSIQLKVIDTGCGIQPENIESIFNHGFTTKREHQGFGLHNSANHMTEMGGKMWAESDGQDSGAAFILEFKDTNM